MSAVLSNSWQFIRTIRPELLAGTAISLITIMSIDLWLINIEELFKGGHELGQILYKLSFSFISGFIFYIIVVHSKSLKDQKNINIYVRQQLVKIVNTRTALLREVDPNSEWDHGNFKIKNTDVETRMKFAETVQRNLANINNQKLIEITSQVTSEMDNIFKKMPFLDSELVRLLSTFENHILFHIVKLNWKNPTVGSPSHLIADQIVAYHNELDELLQYRNSLIAGR